MMTPDVRSPLGMLQEDLQDDPWGLLVGVIMLNLTTARQVRGVIWEFFRRWPMPHIVSAADEVEISDVIKTLGMQRKRARTIVRMSDGFVRGFSDVRELYGIGKYGADSYEIFVRRNLVDDVEDKELKRYVAWARQFNEARDRRQPPS